jgi:hypothetical protein
MSEQMVNDYQTLKAGAQALSQFGQSLQQMGQQFKQIHQRLQEHCSGDESGIGSAVQDATGDTAEAGGEVFAEGGRVLGEMGSRTDTNTDRTFNADQTIADTFDGMANGTSQDSAPAASPDEAGAPSADLDDRGRQIPTPQVTALPNRPGFSLMKPNDPFAKNAQLTEGLPGTYDVIAHGTPEAVQMSSDGSMLSARQLADMIRARDDYKPGTPVRLLSCNTGADVDNDFALQLARQLGAPVMAPEGYLYCGATGRLGVSPDLPDSTPPTRMTGGFSQYSPGGYLEQGLPREKWETTP